MTDAKPAHPSLEHLLAFHQRKLSALAGRELRTHLFDCANCRLALATLTAVSVERDVGGTSTPGGLHEAATLAPNSPNELMVGVEILVALRDHPRYRVLELLGAGGMGAVYKAEHRIMKRLVALKAISPRLVGNSVARERFNQEIRAAAQLSHANIVTAYDADRVGDLHFLVMEYVEGLSLAQIVAKAGPLPVDRACEHARQVAVGLQHACTRGMVHRDIKPQNLMVAPDGVVKILDFGLARFVSESSQAAGRNHFGAVLGTPDYIAPEQVQDPRHADIRADLYALGCTLYFLLTGRPPFAEGDALQKVLAHIEKTPRPVSTFRSDIPVGLGEILDRLLAKQAALRYQSPQEAARALQFFARPPIGATREPALVKKPTPEAPSILPIPVEEVAPKPARATSAKPSPSVVVAVRQETAPAFQRFIAQAWSRTPAEWQALFQDRPLVYGPVLGVLIGLPLLLLALGGYRLLASTKVAQQGAKPGREWKPLDWPQSPSMPPRDPEASPIHQPDPEPPPTPSDRDKSSPAKVPGISPSEGPKSAPGPSPPASGVPQTPGPKPDPPVPPKPKEKWEGQSFALRGHNCPVHCVAVSPDLRHAVSGGHDGTLIFWDLLEGEELWRMREHNGAIEAVAFAPDGHQFVSGGADHILRLWDVPGKKCVRERPGHTKTITGLSFSPDGQRIFSVSADRTLRRWDAYTLREIDKTFVQKSGQARCLAVSPNGRQILTGDDTHWVQRWDADDLEKEPLVFRKWYTGHTGTVEGIAFSADGRTFISGGRDGQLLLWPHGSRRQIIVLWNIDPDRPADRRRIIVPINTVALSDRWALSGGMDGRVCLWTSSGNLDMPIKVVVKHNGAARKVVFTPDGTRAVSCGDDGVIWVSWLD